MKDTTPEARDIQLQILLKKSPEERFLLGCDMIDATYFLVKNSIIRQHPDYTEQEIIAAVFERYYQNDFTKEKIQEIKQAIRLGGC